VLSATNQGSLYLQGGGRMKPYRGTLLATAMLLAALPLSGCGEADNWKTSGDVSLDTSTPTVQVNDKAIFTVQTVPPGPDYTCDTDIEYRAQGAGLNVSWSDVPGIDTTRVFELRPTQTNNKGTTLSVVARSRCLESREDWKYSNQVDVAVTELILPKVTAVTLTASSSTASDGDTIFFTLGATTETGCTLHLKYQSTGPGATGTVDPASAGTFPLTIPFSGGLSGTLTVIASGWCTENPSAVVPSDTVIVKIN